MERAFVQLISQRTQLDLRTRNLAESCPSTPHHHGKCGCLGHSDWIAAGDFCHPACWGGFPTAGGECGGGGADLSTGGGAGAGPAVFWIWVKAVLALFLYGLLPVVRNSLEAFASLPADVLDAARGMGYSRWQLLWHVELPLALPVILAGVRTSLVLILATATVAPLVGGGGLGVPIIAGLAVSNLAFVAQGAIAVALLALLLDWTMGRLEKVLTPWRN